MSPTYQQLGQQIGALVDEKNAAYGSSFKASGDFLRLLYPNGLQPDQYAYALLLVRIFDKQMRIATDADALGESPFQDIAGYGLLGSNLQQERKTRCGSVSKLDAVEESKDLSASAEQPAPRPTTTSAEPSSEPQKPQPSPVPSSDTSNSTAAPTAVNEARANAVALADRVRERNSWMGCGICTATMSAEWASVVWSGECFYFYSRACRADFHRRLQEGW